MKERLWQYADIAPAILVFAGLSAVANVALSGNFARPLAIAAIWAVNAKLMHSQLASHRAVLVGGWQASHDQRYRVDPANGQLRDVRSRPYGSDRYEEYAPGSVSASETYALRVLSSGFGFFSMGSVNSSIADFVWYSLAFASVFIGSGLHDLLLRKKDSRHEESKSSIRRSKTM